MQTSETPGAGYYFRLGVLNRADPESRDFGAVSLFSRELNLAAAAHGSVIRPNRRSAEHITNCGLLPPDIVMFTRSRLQGHCFLA